MTLASRLLGEEVTLASEEVHAPLRLEMYLREVNGHFYKQNES